MTETEFTKKIIASLSKQAFVVKIHGGPYQRVGLPDIYCLRNGASYWIEVKVKKNKLTPIQAHTLTMIAANGGVAMVVNEKARLRYLPEGFQIEPLDLERLLDPFTAEIQRWTNGPSI